MSELKRYRIGFFGSIAIASAFLAFLYSSTFTKGDLETSLSVFVMVMLAVVGVVLASAMVGLKFEPFNLNKFITDMMWTAVCVVAIYIVNRQTPESLLSIGPLPIRVFLVLAGVAEELFFRVWLCTWIDKMTGNQWVAIVVSAGTWSVYHINRYGLNYTALGIIFFAGFALGYVMLNSRSGDGPIFAHAIVNYLA